MIMSWTIVLSATTLSQRYSSCMRPPETIVHPDLLTQHSFCLHFYPHLPILNPTISISSLYELSPILFWTIVAITTARPIIASHQTIIATLREPFVHYFRNEILDAPLPLQTIQAITYLSMFPLTLESQTEDPSWLYSGVAVNAAMYMGLHQAKPAPSLRSIGVYAGSPRARAHTWLGCFVASTS